MPKTHKCPYCDPPKFFARITNLNSHVKSEHTDQGNKPNEPNEANDPNEANQELVIKVPAEAQAGGYHCLGCGGTLTKGQNPCPGCGEPMTWDNIT